MIRRALITKAMIRTDTIMRGIVATVMTGTEKMIKDNITVCLIDIILRMGFEILIYTRLVQQTMPKRGSWSGCIFATNRISPKSCLMHILTAEVNDSLDEVLLPWWKKLKISMNEGHC